MACGCCVKVCPRAAIQVWKGIMAKVDGERCIGCGKCARICPQKIDIPGAMKDLSDRISKLPSWAEICRQREAAANSGKNK